MEREPEPEVMDDPRRAQAYADADFSEVNLAYVERLLEVLPSDEILIILDAGTGPGDIPLLIQAERPGWRIIGLDASVPMLRIGNVSLRNASAANVHFVCGAAVRTPFPENYFDAVISNSILHHLVDPVAFWSENIRILKPGGTLFHRDLRRPSDAVVAQAIVEHHAHEEHPLLKDDFHNSLLAAYQPQEAVQQLGKAEISGLDVQAVTDRHMDIWGTPSV